ncbi:molybdate ABC transporter permease subunit [Dongshaea marina]|uniref:molybdate ABC transporter permease subunit n=1 Tax=Dongshaea marina TaxID=2047966 RepID=UPI000D3E04C8|nr:molybdate ABC transporter permease subunit [Dongshaea marina]
MLDTDLQAVVLTLKLASYTTLLLLCIAPPLAWWLARGKHWSRSFVESIVTLPLVLPPTVLGFYLLIAFSPNHWLGQLWQSVMGSTLAFSFSGLVVSSVIYSLPFVVQPLQGTFVSLGRCELEAAATLGYGPIQRFFWIVLPMTLPGFVIAAALGFAHTMGEFGVVLMIGGNIPGQTEVLSIALFNHVEALEYTQAHQLAAGLLVASVAMLMLVYGVLKKRQQRMLL